MKRLLAMAVSLVLSGCAASSGIGQTGQEVNSQTSDQISSNSQSAETQDSAEQTTSEPCENIIKSSAYSFGIGTNFSVGPFGGEGKVRWRVDDSLFAENANLDTLDEGVICFREGIVRQIRLGAQKSFQDLRDQFEASEYGYESLYFISLEDLIPLANVVFGIASGQEIMYSVPELLSKMTSTRLDAGKVTASNKGSGSTSLALEVGGACERAGATSKVDQTNLECRYQAGMELTWVDTSAVSDVFIQGDAPADWSTCKIRDQRTVIKGLGTSFPIDNFIRMNNPSAATLAIVPIDFPDAKADITTSEFFDDHIATFNRLVKQWAGDNQSFKWKVPDNWIRMPKDSAYYQWDHATVQPDGSRKADTNTQIMSDEDQAFDVFSEAEKVMDLDDVDFVYVIAWPYSDVRFAPYSHARNVKTATSTYDFPYYGFGSHILLDDPDQRKIWFFFFHEMLHFRGLAGHAPGNGMFYSIMTAGESLLGWDAFLMGWLDPNQVLCFDSSDLSSSTFTLSSSDTGYSGPRVAIIRLSASKVLVVDVRRKSWHNYKLPSGFAGLQAYVVDSTNPGERYDSNPDKVKDYYSYYLEIDSQDHSPIPGFRTSNPRETSLNESGFVGDTFTFEGIRISYLASGKLDQIKIEKVN